MLHAWRKSFNFVIIPVIITRTDYFYLIKNLFSQIILKWAKTFTALKNCEAKIFVDMLRAWRMELTSSISFPVHVFINYV